MFKCKDETRNNALVEQNQENLKAFIFHGINGVDLQTLSDKVSSK